MGKYGLKILITNRIHLKIIGKSLDCVKIILSKPELILAQNIPRFHM
jgi:hypothetical protein